MRSKVEKMLTMTTRVQLESDAVFIVMDETWALCHKTKGEVMETTSLMNGSLSWKRNCARVLNMRRLPRCAKMREKRTFYGQERACDKSCEVCEFAVRTQEEDFENATSESTCE